MAVVWGALPNLLGVDRRFAEILHMYISFLNGGVQSRMMRCVYDRHYICAHRLPTMLCVMYVKQIMCRLHYIGNAIYAL